MFLIKKTLMMTKKFYSNDKFFQSNRYFTTEHVKILRLQVVPGLFSDFCSKFLDFPGFFFKISQIPGFPGFQVNKATLYLQK